MPAFIDLTGQSFGRWTALSHSGRKWLCRCACGREELVDTTNLRGGKSQSCGCLRAEYTSARNRRTGTRPDHTSHGMRYTREYETWCSMIQRCEDPNHISYPNYGGRGITVCERWRNSFAAFYADMGARPQGLSIDRYPDTNGPYSPDNCRWATRSQQNLNRRPRHRSHQTVVS